MGKLFRVSLLVFAGMFFLVSCEKEDALVKDNSFVQEEGLKSTTGDQVMPIDASEAEVVLHKHYDGSLTAEEVDAKWIEDKSKFKTILNQKGYSTEWFFDVRTYTGLQTNNESDGRVDVYIHFKTDIDLNHNTGWNTINNPGDDREGGWDLYLVRDYISGVSIQWIELKSAYVNLQGTDGWYIKNYEVRLETSDQNVSATGYSEIITTPELWLDSSTSTGWDSYFTGWITGTGRLTFI